MSIAQVVLEIANDYAASFDARVPAIQREILDLEAQLAKKKDELEAARNARKRAGELPALLKREVICPYCYVGSGSVATLRTIGHGPGDDPAKDMFRCNSCNRTFTA